MVGCAQGHAGERDYTLTLRCRCIYVYTPSPLYIYIFTRSHPQIYLSTSTHPHICTSISHLYIQTVTPSHPPSLSFFLSFFLLSFYISFLSPLYIYIFTRSHLQIYLSTATRLHIYIAPAHPHCHSFTSALSFSLSAYLFSSYFRSNFVATSYSITVCIKKSWLLDNSVLKIS